MTRPVYRLTPQDEKVLSIAQRDFRLSIAEVAKRAGVHTHVAVHSLKKLKEREVLRPYLLTNPHVVGLTDYCIFFNYVGEEKKARQKIINFCLASPKISYFAELTGPYQYSISLFCRNVFEVTDFFEKMRKLLPRSSFETSFALRLEFTQFLGKFFGHGSRRSMLSRTKAEEEFEIDGIDRKILGYYSQHVDAPLRKIAAKVGISESGVRYRLKALEEKGIIMAFPYLIDASKIGMTSFRILISGKGLIDSFQKRIFQFAQSHPSCVIFVRCAGSWDFELNFDVASSSEIGGIVEEVNDSFAEHIRHMHTLLEIAVLRGHHFPLEAGID